MKRRLWNCVRLLSTIVLVAFPAAADSGPNVLMLVVDDMNTWAGCLGHPVAQTPNIDRLASRGRLFSRAYCQQAVCNPSRASVMTGRRPDTLKVWDLRRHFRRTFPDIVTLPQHFKNHGWFTQGIGKIYHNGTTKPQGDPASWSVPQTWHWAPHWKDWVVVGGEKGAEPKKKGGAVQRLDVPDDAYWDAQIASDAIAALRACSDRDQPFFLAVGFWKPHLPFNAPKKYWDLYDRDEVLPPANPNAPRNGPEIALHDWRELRNYAGMPKEGRLTREQTLELRHGYLAAISYVDSQIGRVLDALDKSGEADNTVIALWSDHGFHLGEHSLWCKTSTYEMDARVPLIIAAPKMARPGEPTQAVVELIDLYPTLVDLCGLPKLEGLEGVSLAPVLADPSAAVKAAALTQHPRPAYYRGRPEIMGYSVWSGGFRYTEWRDWKTGRPVEVELYDHARDPLENVNAAREEAYRVDRGRLARLLGNLAGAQSRD